MSDEYVAEAKYVDIVAAQTNSSRERAIKALKENNGNVQDASQSIWAEQNSVSSIVKQTNTTPEKALLALNECKGDVLAAVQSIRKTSTQAQEPLENDGVDGGFNPQDVKLVMEQTNCTREQSITALKKSRGDIVDAIMSLCL